MNNSHTSNLETEIQPPEETESEKTLIVGIGASAGGIKALKEFFTAVPVDSSAAYVVILHLSPDFESKLAEILQTVALIPVTQVRDEKIKVEPNHVYVIPPNKSLTMNDGHLALSPIESYEERRAPVDIFFRTLAESHAAQAVAVILSGTGPNGSMGIKRIKEKGGVCFVQAPSEAEYSDMPRNSIATSLVDEVLPVAEIPAKIIAYREQRKNVRLPLEPAEREETADQSLREIFTKLRIQTGHDFTSYKRGTMLRRIERRINVRELSGLQAYAKFIRENPDEAQILLKDLLISVTNFFRDRDAFENLAREVVPKILSGRKTAETIRIWVAGCATGEEAYSLAMIFSEPALDRNNLPDVQIFATDIDEDAIAAARAGLYSNSDVADVSPERLQRFFKPEGDNFRIRREIREKVLFANHNLIKDPPFSQLDLVSCRNLLIYLNRSAQKRVMEIFHFSLRPGAYLFLSSSETVEAASDLFVEVDKNSHLFQSRAIAARYSLPITDLTPALRYNQPPPKQLLKTPDNAARLSYAALHLQLLEHYAPPSIVINEEHDVVHISEKAGRYLQISGGEPSLNLLAVVRPELRLELRSAIYQAIDKKQIVEARGIAVQIENESEIVNLTVRPVVRPDDSTRGYISIIFERENAEASAPTLPLTTVNHDEPMARQLEEELMRTKTQLRTTVELYEVQAEELKASNEELQAINEEMRSTAEELETGKEELQSVNEELRTVNQELKIKIEELSLSNDDFQNLMNSTDIATIFLDRDLKIKMFTPNIREIFNLLPSDLNRSLTDIRGKFDYQDLLSDMQSVMQKLLPLEREVQTTENRWYLNRITPYRTREDRISGVVLSFVEITKRKLDEENLRESHERTTEILESLSDAFYAVDANFNFTYVNRQAEKLWNRKRETLLGKNLWKEFPAAANSETYQMHLNAVSERHSVNYETISPISNRWSEINIYPDASGGVSCYLRDITSRKEAEAELRQNEERLHLILQSVKDYAVFMVDETYRILSWNAGAAAIFGYSAEEIIGRSGEILCTAEDRAEQTAQREMETARQTGSAADERWHIRKDKTLVYVSGTISPLQGTPDRFVKIVRDLTEVKRNEENLRKAYDALEERIAERTQELSSSNQSLQNEVRERERIEKERVTLLQQIVTSQEDERRRIARDMHDQFGQMLTALRLRLSILKQECGEQTKLCDQIDEVQQIAGRLDEEIDFLAWELRPAALDDLGLTAALSNFVAEWSRHYKIEAEFYVTGIDGQRLAPDIETNLYRIAQEALNNLMKHARATHVSVLIERRNDNIVLIIEDNGIGFDTEKENNKVSDSGRGLGLIGMRERAALIGGEVEIESAPGSGTTIFARVPFARNENSVSVKVN